VAQFFLVPFIASANLYAFFTRPRRPVNIGHVAREVRTRVPWMRPNEDYSRQSGAICGLSTAPDAANERERDARALFASQWKGDATAQVVMVPLIFIHYTHTRLARWSNYRKISLVSQWCALLMESATSRVTHTLLHGTMEEGREGWIHLVMRFFAQMWCCFDLHSQTTLAILSLIFF
jgi:hypothetical protein